ncbi:hypothetical protein M5689_022242 [Euphorbia peplus]|nr:hypothetical protein M5689_022242 [Euphorbia peplus]
MFKVIHPLPFWPEVLPPDSNFVQSWEKLGVTEADQILMADWVGKYGKEEVSTGKSQYFLHRILRLLLMAITKEPYELEKWV